MISLKKLQNLARPPIVKTKKKLTPRPNKKLRNLKSTRNPRKLERQKRRIRKRGKSNKKLSNILTLGINANLIGAKKTTKFAVGKNKTSVKTLVITVIKKTTMLISIPNQKNSCSLSNFYVNDYMSRG